MAKWFKQLLLGSFIGFFGVLVYLLPFGLELEEKFGLNLLFHLRGAITAPASLPLANWICRLHLDYGHATCMPA